MTESFMKHSTYCLNAEDGVTIMVTYITIITTFLYITWKNITWFSLPFDLSTLVYHFDYSALLRLFCWNSS